MLPLKNIKKEEKFCKTLSELYQQLKGEIKKVEPKEARKIWQELYSEFCKQHSYNKEERNSWETFSKLLTLNSNSGNQFYLDYGVSKVNPFSECCSRPIDTENITKLLQKSQGINEQSRDFGNVEVDIDQLDLFKEEFQAQIQIPPKNN